jgi:hypothetical protein
MPTESEMTVGGVSRAFEAISRIPATLNVVSGYIWLGSAAAVALVLFLPSPVNGIDLTPVRAGFCGAAISVATILKLFLWIAKSAAATHAEIAAKVRRSKTSLVCFPIPKDSYWGPTGDPWRLQVHAVVTITNPKGRRRSLTIHRIEVARGQFGDYEECNDSFRVVRDDGSPMRAGIWISCPGSGRLIVDHIHHSKLPQHKEPLLFYIRLTDQYNRRYPLRIHLRHIYA